MKFQKCTITELVEQKRANSTLVAALTKYRAIIAMREACKHETAMAWMDRREYTRLAWARITNREMPDFRA